MELTKRDAILALGALGVNAAGVGILTDERGDASAATVATMRAVAELVYPSAVEATGEFVETYVLGRPVSERHATRRVAAVRALDRRARRDYANRFAALSPNRRRGVLETLGVDRAHSNHEGTTAERIRYYVVDELVYALFASPVGGELVGVENPPGHPGGHEAYRRGPDG